MGFGGSLFPRAVKSLSHSICKLSVVQITFQKGNCQIKFSFCRILLTTGSPLEFPGGNAARCVPGRGTHPLALDSQNSEKA